MSLYEIFKFYLCYAPAQVHELIVCQVSNHAYAHFILAIAWIIFSERSLGSFVCYATVALMGWFEKFMPQTWADTML
jgi:hypothetical protein